MAFTKKILLVMLAFIPSLTLAQVNSYSWDNAVGSSKIPHFDTSRFLSAPAIQPAHTPSSRQAEETTTQQLKRKDIQIARLKKKLLQEQSQSRNQIAKLQSKITRLSNNHCKQQRKIELFPAGPTLNIARALLSPLPGSLAHSLALSSTNALRSEPLREEQKVDYATGILLGKNITLMQQRNQALNIQTDNRIVLAGIEDYLSHNSRLSESEVGTLLAETESALQEATEAYSYRHRQEGAEYVEQFIKRTGTHRAPAGFYYQIGRKGSGKIPAGALVDIQVKESLTDGSVINDMTRSGAIISQRLNEYPPLFQKALSLIGKQGVITLVVPPELAYGDQGYPPSIPPEATMIYELQVVSVTL